MPLVGSKDYQDGFLKRVTVYSQLNLPPYFVNMSIPSVSLVSSHFALPHFALQWFGFRVSPAQELYGAKWEQTVSFKSTGNFNFLRKDIKIILQTTFQETLKYLA
jgi:hypothetical protein